MEHQNKITLIKQWLGSGSLNVFGMPFAGKDTHCRELATFFDAKIIGGGDVMREQESAHIRAHVDQGSLAPTDEYMRIMAPYFSRKEFAGKPIILSSVGRWHGEEAGVLEATAAAGHPVRAVILLDIDKQEVFRRWRYSQTSGDRGQRKDDQTQEILENRIKEFATKTVPVIKFYQDQGMLIRVNGMRGRDIVLGDILDQLARFAQTT